MLKNIILIILMSTGLFAQIPEGYYDGTENLYGDALKSVLNNIIDNHNELSYADLWDALPDTDQDPRGFRRVLFIPAKPRCQDHFASQATFENPWGLSIRATTRPQDPVQGCPALRAAHR